MNKNQVNVSASGERAKGREGAEKTADDKTTPDKGKPRKHGKDETVLGEINDDAKKKQND
ncbi:hypothetical protein CLH62_14655 [Marinobacter guineae]|uniref:Uncharacterized protein n=1 Tax=Marinobacter guineae TaxID=432303 RepID=A0A2G1VBM4_9GAMM|nr:hypothetical protein [Marinobacter guineae]PHQ24171.1 hypothetical protein CLH62_14655 [Marinobacter guineae]